MTSQSRINKAINIIIQDYPFVKEAIIRLEIYTKRLSKRSVYELRDAFDHLFITLSEKTSEENAEKSLDAIQEHLRRAAVEPLECIAEQEKIKLLDMQRKGFWWWRLFMVKPPNIENFVAEIYKGNDYLVEGRKNKGISIKLSVENMQKAYETFSKLRDKLQPTELNSRMFTVLIATIFFVLGLIPFVLTIIF